MFDNLSYKARRRWALVVLVVGLPIYILIASVLATAFGRAHVLIELVIYVALGFAWIWPFKGLFKGIGKPDPDAEPIKWDDEE